MEANVSGSNGMVAPTGHEWHLTAMVFQLWNLAQGGWLESTHKQDRRLLAGWYPERLLVVALHISARSRYHFIINAAATVYSDP